MSTVHRERARAVAARLLTGCLPGAAPESFPVTAGFRCWSPFHDWAAGEEGLAALRQVMRAYCAAVPGANVFQPNAVISDGKHVVVEASTSGQPGQLPVSGTFVLALRSGLVDEVRCYLDPRAVVG